MLVIGLYLAYLFIPIVLLIVGSFGEVWTNTLLPHGVTLRWYAQLLGDPSFRRAFQVGIEVTGSTCVLVTLLATPLAYALYGGAARGLQTAVRIIALLPIAAPQIVLGFGFVLVFSSDALPFLGSLWLLVAGHVVVTLPYMLQTLVSDMRHLDVARAELVAESLGASATRRFFDIVLPMLRHSLTSGLITVAAISIGEFQLSNLVAGFLSRPYAVVLLQAFYGATGFASAATVVLLMLALLAAATGALAARSAYARLPAAGGAGEATA
jgi:putative spermidine/putrescine transport system permease protein